MHGTVSVKFQAIMGGECLPTLVALAFDILVASSLMARRASWVNWISTVWNSTDHRSMIPQQKVASQLFQALKFLTTGASDSRMISSSDPAAIQFRVLKVE